GITSNSLLSLIQSLRSVLYLTTFIHSLCFFFFFNDTATTEIYTLSLHDALPISAAHKRGRANPEIACDELHERKTDVYEIITRKDRKSTRLNSSHSQISYAVFCLKKKKKKN